MSGEPASVFRVGGISYLEIPAPDPPALAAFYAAAFGWSVRTDPEHAAFEDATGDVIGHFVRDREVAGEAGVRAYVYVESVDDALAAVAANGGSTATPPAPEGGLRVAAFRDPAGNVLGLWQRVAPAP
jgi:predicted enzyme related to lactoylglutathione lyase